MTSHDDGKTGLKCPECGSTEKPKIKWEGVKIMKECRECGFLAVQA